MPAICLNELANYNNGELVYQWFDLNEYPTADDYREAVQEWLKSCSHPHNQECEEWNIGDIDGIPDHYYDDYTFDADGFYEYKAILDEVGEELLNAWPNLFHALPESARHLKEKLVGSYEFTLESPGFFRNLGITMVEEAGLLAGIPEAVARYFDYEKYGRDQYMDMSADSGFIFRN